MTGKALYVELLSRGVRFRIEDGRLKWRAPSRLVPLAHRARRSGVVTTAPGV